MTRVVILVLFFIAVAPNALAQEAVIVKQERPFDIGTLSDIETKRVYLGELDNFPHTFEIVITTPTDFSAELYTASETDRGKFSGIITTQIERGVREIGRMRSEEASWEPYNDQVRALTLFEGPTFNGRLNPGFYRFEVSSPLNRGKYMLTLGDGDDGRGYIETLRDVYVTQRFFDNPRIAIFTSPLVYIPFILFVLGVLSCYFFVRRKRAQTHV